MSSPTPSLIVLIVSTLATSSTVTLDQSFDSWMSNLPLISIFSLRSPFDSSHPPLTNSQSTWSSSVKIILLVSILIYSHRYPRSLTTTHLTSDILMSSLYFCCQIFLWFRIFLALTNWLSHPPLIDPQSPWSSDVDRFTLLPPISCSHPPDIWYSSFITGLLHYIF